MVKRICSYACSPTKCATRDFAPFFCFPHFSFPTLPLCSARILLAPWKLASFFCFLPGLPPWAWCEAVTSGCVARRPCPLLSLFFPSVPRLPTTTVVCESQSLFPAVCPPSRTYNHDTGTRQNGTREEKCGRRNRPHDKEGAIKCHTAHNALNAHDTYTWDRG